MPLSAALSRIASEREEFDGAFLHCRDCAAVHRISGSDQAPVPLSDGSLSAADDFRHFLSTHIDHQLVLLRRSSEAEMLSHARWDPMCRVVWEVSDGQNDFIVTSGRTDVEGPRQYVITPGRLMLESETIDIDSETLRHEIDEALFPHSAPPSRIFGLVKACRRMVTSLSADGLDLVAESRDDPNVQLACLPESVARSLRREVGSLFAAEEAERLFEVIDDDLCHGIPIIRLTRRYRIETED